MFKYDLHAHSCECSACAKSTVKEMVKAYKRAGYAGFVLTNHFITGNTSVDRNLPWDEQMRRYWSAVSDMRNYAAKLDIDLLFGLEHYYGGGKEVLIYGIDYDFLVKNSDIPNISVDELAARVHDYGGFIAHAHPFRIRPYINPTVPNRFDICDGIEVYNAANSSVENDAAERWNKEYGLVPISGSDCHDAHSRLIGMAGIEFNRRVRDERTLARLLRERQGWLIIDGVAR